MWDGYAVVLVVEDGLAFDHVQRDAVGELHLLERGLLGEDFIDVGREQGEGREEGGAQRALDGRFELLLGRGGHAATRGREGLACWDKEGEGCGGGRTLS